MCHHSFLFFGGLSDVVIATFFAKKTLACEVDRKDSRPPTLYLEAPSRLLLASLEVSKVATLKYSHTDVPFR